MFDNTHIIFSLFRIVTLLLVKMKLNSQTSFFAFLVIFGLAKSAAVPTALSSDTSEYLRVLAGIKAGTLKLPSQNMSSIPWVYSSQGLEFEEKLKQSMFILNFNF